MFSPHTDTNNWLQTRDCTCITGILKINKDLMQASCSSYNSPTSSKLLKHQVEFVFLFKELHQLQDVTTEKEKII